MSMKLFPKYRYFQNMDSFQSLQVWIFLFLVFFLLPVIRCEKKFQCCCYVSSSGNAVEAQLVPIPKPVLSVPGRNSSATYELVFLASNIPSLGFLRFHIQKTANYRVLQQQMSSIRSHKMDGDVPIKLVGEVGLAWKFFLGCVSSCLTRWHFGSFTWDIAIFLCNNEKYSNFLIYVRDMFLRRLCEVEIV